MSKAERFSYPKGIENLTPRARRHRAWAFDQDLLDVPPRQPRIDLPGVPQQLVQRSNDRRPCFFAPIDRTRYLDELREAASRHGCTVHADVLLTHHVPLLLTPAAIGCVSAIRLRWAVATSATSMIATAAPAPVGKAASSPAQCTASITRRAAAATSNSIRSMRAGSAKPATRPGRATQQTRRARPTRWSARTRSSWRCMPKTGAVDSVLARPSLRRSAGRPARRRSCLRCPVPSTGRAGTTAG